MYEISLFKDTIQSFCNILNSILGTEIMVIDKDLVAIAGTGPYKKNIGTRRPRDSYVDMTIRSGESYMIEAPRETRQCLRCEIRSICPYSSVISSPLRYKDKIVGIFGFLGYSSNQRKIMLNQTTSLANLSDEIADLFINVFLRKPSSYVNCFFRSEMDRVINSINEGIVLTDQDNRIININQFAEKLLKLKKKECLGKDLSLLGDELKINSPGYNKDTQESETKTKIPAIATPIKPDSPRSGYAIVFPGRLKDKKIKRSYHFINIDTPPEIIGVSDSISKLIDTVAKIAKNDSSVLITGETGSGKELVANLIHYQSQRKHKPFVVVNCAAIPETLFESELFGYKEGAFTGAKKNGKIGKLETANGGTLCLDEIGYLPLNGQSKILRFLDDSMLEKIGENNPKKLDVRIIASTNKNLKNMLQEKSFLEDLYYRLNVIPLCIPPLRERIVDIPLLLGYFLSKTNKRFGISVHGFDSTALNHLIAYHWPGNVRELKNVVEYVCNIKNDGLVELNDLPPYLKEENCKTNQSRKLIAQTERLLIDEAIRIFGNSTKGKEKASKYLGISLTTLYRRLGNYSPFISKH